jgi:hypothetical protein
VLKSATDYAAASKSGATRRAYRADWADFTRWCEGMAVTAIPSAQASLASYLALPADFAANRRAVRCRAIRLPTGSEQF